MPDTGMSLAYRLVTQCSCRGILFRMYGYGCVTCIEASMHEMTGEIFQIYQH